MPQNPVPSSLFVTKVIPGAGINVSPASETGFVTVSVGPGAPVTVDITSATPPSTHGLDIEMVLSAATVNVAGNSNIVPIRGNVTVNSGTNLQSGYFYGAEGKVTCAGTITLGSDYLTGAIGQLNLAGATVVSGHIAAVIANIQNPVASSYVDLFYAELSGPAVINSVLKGIGNTAFVMDVAPDSGTSACINTTGTAGATATKGWLKIQVNDGVNPAATRYIPLTDSVS